MCTREITRENKALKVPTGNRQNVNNYESTESVTKV